MKRFKRLLLALALLFVLGIAFLLAAPILFEDQVKANVKTGLNKMLLAEVDFEDINLSFLRSFPDVQLLVDDLVITGVDTFAGQPFLSAKRAQVDVGFWSVVGGSGTYNIDEVALDEPFVNLQVLGPNLANYLIWPTAEETIATDPSPAPVSAQVNLSRFQINNGRLIYDDSVTSTYLEVEGLNGSGTGDFTATIFDLDTEAAAEALTIQQGGITYLNQVATKAKALVNIDLMQNRYTFTGGDLLLNALALQVDGAIDLEENDDIVFDLSYSAPVNDFRQLWSLIPSAYTAGYDQVQTKGRFTLNGTVNGPYNGETNKYPAFTLATEVENGSVQYPGRPVGLEAINAQIALNSPSSNLDQLVIDVRRFDFDLGGDPFRGRFRLGTPISDPQVDAKIDGILDLRKWSQAIPLEGVRDLAGKIVANVTLNQVRQSLLDAGRYNDLNLGGNISITDFSYVTDDLPPVGISKAAATFTPQALNLEASSMTLGRSDLNASGKINNPLAYFSPEQTMEGELEVRSDFFDADEWVPTEEEIPGGLSPAELAAATEVAQHGDIFNRFDIEVDAAINTLNYAGYRPTNLKATGKVKPNRLDISSAAGTLGESTLSGSGTLLNLFDYTFGEGVLGGDLAVTSKFLDFADFMVEEGAGSSASGNEEGSIAAVPIPTNINLNIDVQADKVRYDNINLNAIAGRLVMLEGQAVVEDGSAALLGGRMNFAGAYDTSEP
ncbi:MAG: hypothetical protein AAF840_11545, partial [Bacteroidota bacterium]